MVSIKEEALFIADAHYPHHGDEFLQILRQLDSGERQTPQLFLMGDIFDLLFGYNRYVQTFSDEAIL
ncbi:MAG: UDP-2,3-diacylglucosamine diphosphatase, partial [Campylobacterales bacterium]|nr:UDP-2,3-diacylglucosamine diphosphatase [Campylobacterales bacterium]